MKSKFPSQSEMQPGDLWPRLFETLKTCNPRDFLKEVEIIKGCKALVLQEPNWSNFLTSRTNIDSCHVLSCSLGSTYPGEVRAAKWGRHSSRDHGEGGDGPQHGGGGGEERAAQHDGPQWGGKLSGDFCQVSSSANNNNCKLNFLLTRCKSQIEAYDAIEGKIKEFGGHIGYFNVTRTDLASLEFNTEQMIPVQNWWSLSHWLISNFISTCVYRLFGSYNNILCKLYAQCLWNAINIYNDSLYECCY